MVEEVQRDKGPEQRTEPAEREREREGGTCTCTAGRRQRGRSGLPTLAFSANCYSFTLPLFPRTLDLQSLHGRRAQQICLQPCTSTSKKSSPRLLMPDTLWRHHAGTPSWFGKLHDRVITTISKIIYSKSRKLILYFISLLYFNSSLTFTLLSLVFKW